MSDSCSLGSNPPRAKTYMSIGLELFVVSFLALFCEMVVIRWLATEIRTFAYFKNVPLLAVFLGLGLGFVWAERKHDFYKWSAFGLLCLAGLLTVAFKLGLTYITFVNPDQFMLWGLGSEQEKVTPLWQTIRSLLIMSGVFVLTSSIFIGLGQRMGKLFSQMRPLSAYSINVAGGFLGTLLLLALSFMNTGPGIWMIIAGALYFLIDRRPVSAALVCFGIAYGVWLAPFITAESFHGDAVETVWSPYYRIDVVRLKAPPPYQNVQLGYNVYINYDSFQSIVDCTDATLARLPQAVRNTILDSYTEPFRLSKNADQRVLILGSGSGSDVAAALRCGVKSIDAVEIDPCIATIGKQFNPNRPYSSPYVSLHVTDARNFLQNCRKKYDVIVFATLDSHAAFSSLSSLRMDNYVFTEESLKQAAHLLKPDGIIYINFIIPGDWLWQRHAKALSLASGMVPVGYRHNEGLLAGTLMAGPGIKAANLPEALRLKRVAAVNLDTPIDIATDDWPFLFLPHRGVSLLYALPLLVMLAIGALPVSLEFAKGACNLTNWQMFFLGMGFMLLEVRAMADLSLLFGSTWIINTVIISAVLVVILIANFLAMRISQRFVSGLLAGVLVLLMASALVGADTFIRMGALAGGACGISMYLMPLIFASAVFALLFKSTEHPSTALSFNLIGGGVGICLEYLSMSLGVRALGVVGGLLYAVVLVLHLVATKNAVVDRKQLASEGGKPAE